jgi:hypothetical protein
MKHVSLHLAALSLIGCLAACQSAKVEQPLTADLAAATPEAKMEFWHQMNDQPVTSNDQAFHGLLLFFDAKDGSADYAARLAAVKSRGWLPADFAEAERDSVKRGTVAVVLCNALHIRGGVTLRVFGSGPRYALRELQHVGVYPPSSPLQTFSGAQFVALIGRVEDYQRQKGLAAAPEPAP